MTNLRSLAAAAFFCGGGLFLSGCHSQETQPGSVPIPAPHAAPSPQAQAQEIDNNPHIPDAQKAAIKASIAAHAPSGSGAAPAPGL